MAADCSKPSLFKLALYKSAFNLTFSAVFRQCDASSSSAATFTPPGSGGAVGLAIAASLCAAAPTTNISDVARRSELLALAHGLAAASFDRRRVDVSMDVNYRDLSEDYTFVVEHLNENTTIARAFYSGEDSRTIREEVVLRRRPAVLMELERPPAALPFQVAEFLRSCLICSKALDDKDVYIYKYVNRGEKAFCSDECRYKHIFYEEIKSAVGSSGPAALLPPKTETLPFPCATSSPLAIFELGASK